MPVCRTNDGTASAFRGASATTPTPTATIPSAPNKRRIVALPLSAPWIAHSARTSLMRTRRFVALLLDVLQEGLDLVFLESEIGHFGVVVLREERFGGGIGVEHRRGIRHPAAQPVATAALRHARQVWARPLALPDRMTPDTAAALKQRLAALRRRGVDRRRRLLCRHRPHTHRKETHQQRALEPASSHTTSMVEA